MDVQHEIRQQFRNQQEKLTYYIIGLDVAAIGFAVHRTSDMALSISQIPLGIALLCWGISIIYGFSSLKFVLGALASNHEFFEVQKGKHPDVGSHPERIKAATDGIKSAMERNSNRAEKFFNSQNIYFEWGILFFIIWHVYEMYLNSLN